MPAPIHSGVLGKIRFLHGGVAVTGTIVSLRQDVVTCSFVLPAGTTIVFTEQRRVWLEADAAPGDTLIVTYLRSRPNICTASQPSWTAVGLLGGIGAVCLLLFVLVAHALVLFHRDHVPVAKLLGEYGLRRIIGDAYRSSRRTGSDIIP